MSRILYWCLDKTFVCEPNQADLAVLVEILGWFVCVLQSNICGGESFADDLNGTGYCKQ
jgi:hypothetical protein